MKRLLLAVLAMALVVFSAPSYAGWADGTFGGLSAKIYTPNSKPASGRMLFVNLHGCAQTNADLQKSNWDAVAEKYNAVVVLPNAGHKTSIACWNYGDPSINTSDMNALVTGTKAIIADGKYGIDPNQVYMTGISSGAAFAATVGCANPDLYAGVGAAAGPTIKSKQANAISGGAVDVDSVVSYCKGLAKDKAAFYKTQLWAQTYGAELPAKDGVCAPGYIEPNHKISQRLLGLTGGATHQQDTPAAKPIAGHTSVTENEHYVKDGNAAKRITLIEVPGMGHNWPGGVPKAGSVGKYVSDKFDFGEWMAVNFTDNNCRIAANQGKPQCGVAIKPVKNLICGAKELTAVNLAWQAPEEAVDGYEVSKADLSKTTTATSYHWDGLKKGMSHRFSVRATKGSVKGQATDIQCDTDGAADALPAPTGLKATPTVGTVTLSWNAVEGAKGYQVYRNDQPTAVGAAPYTDTGLAGKTSYQYAVSTINKDNVEGAKGAPIKVTTTAIEPPKCWSQTVSATASAHFAAKRLDLSQFLAAGNKLGYINAFPLYGYGSPTKWTNKTDCSAMAF